MYSCLWGFLIRLRSHTAGSPNASVIGILREPFLAVYTTKMIVDHIGNSASIRHLPGDCPGQAEEHRDTECELLLQLAKKTLVPLDFTYRSRRTKIQAGCQEAYLVLLLCLLPYLRSLKFDLAHYEPALVWRLFRFLLEEPQPHVLDQLAIIKVSNACQQSSLRFMAQVAQWPSMRVVKANRFYCIWGHFKDYVSRTIAANDLASFEEIVAS